METTILNEKRPQEHLFRLCLAPELRMGLIRLQADKTLGPTYACLLAVTEGLHTLGYLKQQSYEKFQRKYSEKLVPDLSPEEIREADEIDRLEELYTRVLEEWPRHPEPWRRTWIRKAEKHRDRVKSARTLLDLQEKVTP